MLKKAKKLFIYGMLERDQFEKVAPLIANENLFVLRLATIVQFLYFGVSLLGSLGYSEMADKRLVYGIGTALPLIVLIIQFFFAKKHPRIIPWLVRICGSGLFLTGLLCTLFCTPDEMTILLLIFFFCIPMLFVERPIDLVILVVLADAVYFSVAPQVKTSEVLSMDMIDVGIFSTLSLILGVSHMLGQFRRYWLEANAVDLAEVRYQAAYIDQLTGAYNRNAYNRDSEELRNSPLPPDFMLITMDLNGLKSANDSLGHSAGDELITGAAKCLMASFSDYGKIYRVGGDEFNIILRTKGVPAGEILSAFNRTAAEWRGALVRDLSVSYGYVMREETEGLNFHEIELLADRRMYENKANYYKNAGVDRRRH